VAAEVTGDRLRPDSHVVQISLKTPNRHTLGTGERRREGNRFRVVLAKNEQKIPLHGVKHGTDDGDDAVCHDPSLTRR